MKMHKRNLLIAIGIYFVTFLGIFFYSMIVGIIYMDRENPDETIYIISIFAPIFVSLVSYLVFFKKQRDIANKAHAAKYLGLSQRIIGGLIASVIATAILVLCFFWTSDYGEEISLLRLYIEIAAVFLGIFIVVNLVNFIWLKPRY